MASVILATAGYDHKIRFWEATSGICSHSISFPDSQVNSLEISPNKQLIAAAGNPQIRLFEINNSNNNNNNNRNNNDNIQPVMSYDDHTNNVTSIGFQKDGKWLYSSSEDGTVKIFDLRAPGCQRSYDCESPANTVILHPNQVELISGHQNGSIRVWDIQNNSCESELIPAGDVPIRSLSIASDASCLVAGNNLADVFVWKPESTKEFTPIKHFRAHDDSYLLKCVISPDVKYLVTTSSDSTARLWNIENDWELEKTLAQHQRWVWDAVFSADSSYLVTGSSDHTARLWNIESGDVIKNYTGHQLAITCVALNDHSS